jgi:hypothetical protein
LNYSHVNSSYSQHSGGQTKKDSLKARSSSMREAGFADTLGSNADSDAGHSDDITFTVVEPGLVLPLEDQAQALAC